MANKNLRSLSERKADEKNLFEQIAKASAEIDSKTALSTLAKDYKMNRSTLVGSSSFYDFLKEENKNKKIHICNGSACLTAGTQDSLHTEMLKYFPENEIGHASCLGHCHSNHAFLYKNKTYSITYNSEIKEILDNENYQENQYFVTSFSKPILTKRVIDEVSFFKLANKFQGNSEKILQEIKDSNLRGRGGAGFPFWMKLDSCCKTVSEKKYIVCNADEGDPGAYSDMYLLENQAFKVLFGMYISGIYTGADEAYIYIRAEYPHSIEQMQKAIDELIRLNLTPNFKWKIIKGQGAYICGEETALLSSIEGLRPEVRVRPPFPAQYGLYGKPTVLSNVETFANLNWILENGGLNYAKMGSIKSTGTKLISLDGHFRRPGIYEVEMGTSMMDIIDKYGLGFNKSIKAVQVGGPLGGIVPIHILRDLKLDFESFAEAGFLMGHASFVCIPATMPMVKYLEHLLKFTADESCGKCFPCRLGSQRAYELFIKAQNEKYIIDKSLLDDLAETLQATSLCALGGGIPLPLKNAMEYFKQELQEFIRY